MKKLILLIIPVCFLCIGCNQTHDDKLTIATAANMQFAIKEISQKFTEETGIACETIVSSSGKLTAQIKEGAPFHVFVSADMKYPTDLFKGGFTTTEPKIYAYGKLVLWAMADDLEPTIAGLTSSEINHIALANPKTAPYGAAAMEVLKHYGIFEKVKDKLVYGESISQTNQFITTKAAELGFTSKSVVLSPEIKYKGHWIEIDTGLYSPIAQGIVIIKNRNNHQEQAKQFYNFLLSGKGKKILDKFGYLVDQ